MRRLVVISLISLSPLLGGQISERAPDALLDAGHCLAADQHDWLDVARDKPYEVELGIVSTDKSGAGTAPLYLIEFTTPTHSEGFAFVFESRGKKPHRELLLQFRTRFRQADDGSQRASLIDPPLGGVGTEDDILGAIRQIGFHTWKVPVASLQSHSGSAHCDMGEAVM